MHLEVLVEERSAEAALRQILPRIAPAVSFEIRIFGGKPDLLVQLPKRLRAYHKWIPEDLRVVVLVDADSDDCGELKASLERVAKDADFTTKASPCGGGRFEVVNRIAIEELEAWFFGDVEALVTAYPRVPVSLDKQARYRHPDAVPGSTWEALERVLQRASYYRGGIPKIEVAERVAKHMEDPARNRSPSFQVFVAGVQALVDQA